MSKPKTPRALSETEAQCVVRNIRISPQKLNLVAGLIRNRLASVLTDGSASPGTSSPAAMATLRRVAIWE